MKGCLAMTINLLIFSLLLSLIVAHQWPKPLAQCCDPATKRCICVYQSLECGSFDENGKFFDTFGTCQADASLHNPKPTIAATGACPTGGVPSKRQTAFTSGLAIAIVKPAKWPSTLNVAPGTVIPMTVQIEVSGSNSDIDSVRCNTIVKPQGNLPTLVRPLKGTLSDVSGIGKTISVPNWHTANIPTGQTFYAAGVSVECCDNRGKVATAGPLQMFVDSQFFTSSRRSVISLIEGENEDTDEGSDAEEEEESEEAEF